MRLYSFSRNRAREINFVNLEATLSLEVYALILLSDLRVSGS
jgi:hypothetical protein